MTDNRTTELLREAEREIVILRDKLRIANGTGAKTCVKCGTLLSDELLCTECAIAAWNTRAELGSGTLTAEQVRETVEKHWHDIPEEYDMPEATALPEYSYDWQAIADELNAEIGGTCKLIYDDEGILSCSQCGRHVDMIIAGEDNFCSGCGRLIQKAVRR